MFEGWFYSTSTLYLLRCSPSRHLWHVPSAAGVSSNATKYPRRSFQYQQYDRKWKNFTNRNCRIFFLGGSQMISRKRTLMFQWSLRQRRSSCLGETIRGEIARTAVVRRISRQSIVHLSATAYGLPRSEDHPQSKGNNFRFATWLRVTYKWDILTCLAIWYMYVRFNHDLYSVLHKYAYPNRMSAVLHPRSSSFLLFWQRFSC